TAVGKGEKKLDIEGVCRSLSCLCEPGWRVEHCRETYQTLNCAQTSVIARKFHTHSTWMGRSDRCFDEMPSLRRPHPSCRDSIHSLHVHVPGKTQPTETHHRQVDTCGTQKKLAYFTHHHLCELNAAAEDYVSLC
ncbi:unnamed protein product, partial [Ectocarpus sp. 12 AP-2014]